MVSHHWRVRVLTDPSIDSELSLWVQFDNVRFLFGCGEGMQRVMDQRRLTIKGLKGVFLPGGRASGRNGLPGLILTAATQGVDAIDVIGPPDTPNHVASFRNAVAGVTRSGEVDVRCFPFPRSTPTGQPVPIYPERPFSVQGVALRPIAHMTASTDALDGSTTELSGSSSREEVSDDRANAASGSGTSGILQSQSADRDVEYLTTPLLAEDGRLRNDVYNRRDPFPLPTREDTETEMVYICHGPARAGRFDAKMAEQLNIPSGPLRAKLVKGESVEVKDPSAEGGILIVVNCSTHNLDALLASPAFQPFQAGVDPDAPSRTETVSLVVHRVTSDVWADERYRAWLNAFGESTEHLVTFIDKLRTSTTYHGAAWLSLRLWLLDSDLFPLLYCLAKRPEEIPLPPRSWLLAESHLVEISMNQPPIVSPHHEKDVAFPSTTSEIQTAAQHMLAEMPDFEQAMKIAQERVRADPRWKAAASEAGDDITVTTLGTGSAVPSKYRNVSATLLQIPGVGNILLDCGENTLGQLRRRFGPDGAAKALRQLRLIFISHMHADHHLGLQALLEARFRLGISTPLYLIAPYGIALSLRESASWQHDVPQEALNNLVWIDNTTLNPNTNTLDLHPEGRPGVAGDIADELRDLPVSKQRWPRYELSPDQRERLQMSHYRQLCADLGLESVQVPEVWHRGRAHGLVLTHSAGWRIVYSGDTRPCHALTKYGKDATLLIHEATLEDGMEVLADTKGHSTFSQAIGAGKRMGAKHILLNHFSQRYPRFPKFAIDDSRSPRSGSPGSPGKGDANAPRPNPIVAICFDLMSVQIGQMWRLKYYLDAMALTFTEDEVETSDPMLAIQRDVNGADPAPSQSARPDSSSPFGLKRPSRGGWRPQPGFKRPRGGDGPR